nr:hypothetical protein [Asaia astilbis]
MKLRTGLLLGTAFLAGITAGPKLEAIMRQALADDQQQGLRKRSRV